MLPIDAIEAKALSRLDQQESAVLDSLKKLDGVDMLMLTKDVGALMDALRENGDSQMANVLGLGMCAVLKAAIEADKESEGGAA